MAYADTILDVTTEKGKRRTLRGHKIIDLFEISPEVTEVSYARGPGSLQNASIDQAVQIRIQMPYQEALAAWQRSLSAWEFDG